MLTTKTILGAGWTVSARLAGRAVDFVTLLVLARALTPADFGLTAIASTLVLVLDSILEIPSVLALMSLKSVSKSHLDTAFTLGVLRGVFLSAVLLVAAWPVALIYHDTRLIAVIATLTIAPVARSLNSPGMVTYIRDMSFRQSFMAELLGRFVASVAAISVVYLDGGYWAIVVNTTIANVTTAIMSFILAPYRPRFSLSRFSEFGSFLGWFSVAQIFKAISWQSDRILLGYYFTKSDLGQYSTANDLANLPLQSLVLPAMPPLMAAFARINDNRERLCSAYLKASGLVMMLAAPTCIGISLTSDLLVNLILGAKWTEAGFYLQWLSFAVVLNVFYQPMSALAIATRRTDLVFRLSVIEACLRITLVLVGLYLYSLTGVIISQIVMSAIMFVLSMLYARMMTGAPISSQLIGLWKVATACLAMTGAVLIVRHGLQGKDLSAILELLLIAFSGATTYTLVLVALGIRLKNYLSAFGAPN
jgi:O-antigen/teichoic acid export membrane protein